MQFMLQYITNSNKIGKNMQLMHPTTCCLWHLWLETASYKLPITIYQLQIANYNLSITNCQLQIANCQLLNDQKTSQSHLNSQTSLTP